MKIEKPKRVLSFEESDKEILDRLKTLVESHKADLTVEMIAQCINEFLDETTLDMNEVNAFISKRNKEMGFE